MASDESNIINIENAANVLRRVDVVTGIAVDTYQVSTAIYTDCTQTRNERPGKSTARTVASVAGGQAAAAAASSAGAYVGGAIGAAFGGAGAVPGAFIGGLVGGIAGSFGGSKAAKAVVNDQSGWEHKKKMNDNHLNCKLLKELECPVRVEYKASPIKMCENGHNICSSRRLQVSACPTCKGMFNDVRNICLEDITATATYPCKNREAGCTETFTADYIIKHQSVCLYESKERPFRKLSDVNCPWFGTLSDLAAHVRSKHGTEAEMAAVDVRRLVDISSTVIPGHLGQAAEMASKERVTLENAGLLTGVAADAYHLGKAINTDCTETNNERPGKHTAGTVSNVAVGWAGATAGSSTGATVGGAFGALCGGVGAVPGAFIGGAIGSMVTIPTKRPGGSDIFGNCGTACVKEHGKRFAYEGFQCPFKLLSGVECTWTGSLAEVEHYRLHHCCETQDNTGPFAVKLQNVSKSNNFHKMLFLSEDLFYLLWVMKDDILYFLVYLVPKDDSADYTYDFKIQKGKQEISVTGGTCGNFRIATSTVLENGDIIKLHSSTVQRYLDENDALTCVIEVRRQAAIHAHKKVPDTTTGTLLEQSTVGPQQASCCSSKQYVHNRDPVGAASSLSANDELLALQIGLAEISNAKIRRMSKSSTLSKRNMNTKKIFQKRAMKFQQAAL